MAAPRPGQDGFCIDPRLINYTGSWDSQGQQEGREYTEHGYVRDTDALDGNEAQTSSYPSAPLHPGQQSHHGGPYFFEDLDESARQANGGQIKATLLAHVASEPFNLLRGRSPVPPPNVGDGQPSLDDLIDPLLSAEPFDKYIAYPQDEDLPPTRADDSNNAASVSGVPQHILHSDHVATNSAPNGQPGHKTAVEHELSGQQHLDGIIQQASVDGVQSSTMHSRLQYSVTNRQLSPSKVFGNGSGLDSILQRRTVGKKRDSEGSISSAQPSTPLFSDSGELVNNSRSVTTPSQPDPAKQRRVRGPPRSKAGTSRAVGSLAGRQGSDSASPNSGAPGVSRPPSSVTSTGDYGCDECPKRFKTRANQRHHAGTHNPIAKTRYRCPDCLAGFRYPKDVRRHRRKRHSSEDSRVQCGLCGRLLSREDNLNRHHNSCHGDAASSDN